MSRRAELVEENDELMEQNEELREELYDEDEDGDRFKREAILKPTSNSCFKIFALVMGIIFLLSGIALIIIDVSTNNGTIEFQSTTMFRTGAGSTSRLVDVFPAPLLEALNNIDLLIFYSISHFAAGVAFLLMYFLFDSMLEQVAYGSNGYMWAAIVLATIFFDVTLAIRCGLQDLTVLIFDGMLHFSILAVIWLGDLLNQRFYRRAMERLDQGRFSYAFLIFVVLLFIVVWGMQLVSLFYAISQNTGAPNVVIVTPLVAVVFYAVMIVLVGIHYGGYAWVGETQQRDLAVAIVVGVMVFVVVWLDEILIFSTNYINRSVT
jgi:hypothetical protein